MIEDDLEVLVDFRSAVPAADEETVQRIYRFATTPRPRWRVLLPVRLSRHRRLALAVALVGVVLVPAALALGGKIVDVFQGTPAPPAVSTAFEGFNRFADATIREGFARQSPQADVSKAHGVIEIQRPTAPKTSGQRPTIRVACAGSSTSLTILHQTVSNPGSAPATRPSRLRRASG